MCIRDSLKVAAEALEQGYLVCIFPEGQLTRSGGMNEFKRGFEMIAKKAKCPVLPASMDGLWGSIFSFERGKFICKIPYTVRYGVTVNFGEIIAPTDIKAAEVRSSVAKLRAEMFAMRRPLENPMSILGEEIEILASAQVLTDHYQQAVNELRAKPAELQKQVVANALQLGDVNAIGREQTVMIEWPSLEGCRDVVAIALAQYLKLKLILVDSDIDVGLVKKLKQQYAIDHFVGGAALSEICAQAGLERTCFDFSEGAVSRNNALPCLVVQERVIAVSMPHPDAETATNQHQAGYREQTWGRLLPGFYLITENDNLLSLIHISEPTRPY